MNNIEINQHLLAGRFDTPEVLPHLDELRDMAVVFDQNFGLDKLPTEPGILMIRGPRQYGKSTWLEQNIKSTIQEFGPGSALYLNGDAITDHQDLWGAIRDIRDFFPSQQKIKRIFIDEITAIPNWERALKRLADAGELRDILVITTGSKALDLRRGSERLPGRKGRLDRTNYIFTPIGFAEFNDKCGDIFGTDILWAYILSGGSAIGINSLVKHGRIAEYITDLISDWVLGEFAFSGRNRANVIAILATLYKFAPNPVGQTKLARESGFANNTVAKSYAEIFADLMLMLPSYQYDPDKQISIFRKECKYHFINTFFAMCMHPKKPRTISELKAFDSQTMAPVLEWTVAQEIWRQSCIENKHLDILNFWQNSAHEVDFVIPESNTWIEVKSGHENPTNFAWVSKYLHDNQTLHVINKDQFDSRRVKGITIQDFLLSQLY